MRRWWIPAVVSETVLADEVLTWLSCVRRAVEGGCGVALLE